MSELGEGFPVWLRNMRKGIRRAQRIHAKLKKYIAALEAERDALRAVVAQVIASPTGLHLDPDTPQEQLDACRRARDAGAYNPNEK